jgi:hypothetical protein
MNMHARSSLAASFVLAVLVGNITDKTTGQPMPGVSVSLGAAHTTSRDDGTYRLTGVKPGRATLRVSSHDVPPQSFPVTVGKTTSHADIVVCSVTLDYSCGVPQ